MLACIKNENFLSATLIPRWRANASQLAKNVVLVLEKRKGTEWNVVALVFVCIVKTARKDVRQDFA